MLLGVPMQHHLRRLVAVQVADVVGYTRLMEAHEEQTHERLTAIFADLVAPAIARWRGRIVKNTGDGFLAIYDSVHDAVLCALELQQSMSEAADGEPVEQRIGFRIAVNLADVIVERDDIFGGGVNVAARLQTYAEPGGVVVTGAVAEQIPGLPGVATVDLGKLHLHNMARPVRVYSLRSERTPRPLIGDAPRDAETRPSIAVLPFRKHQDAPEDAYFADGIVDDIIHALGGLKELFVISRGSTLHYGGANIDVRAIGRELGVRYVLYGSLRRVGDRLRIQTELSDAETGLLIRSDRYDGTVGELFALQERISINVLKIIAPHVRERELTRAMRKHPQNMTAYDFVLQAIDQLYRMDESSFARARGLLQQAIAHDPNYAPAYTYTAYWYILRVGEIGTTDFDADAAAGAHYAAAAIERDANDPIALAIYGHVQSFLLKDCERGRAFLGRAVESGPNSAMAWSMSSATHGYIGDGVTAIRHAEQGVRLSPLDARTFWHEGMLAQAHYIHGDFEEALAWAKRAVNRNTSIRFNLRTLMATQAALGLRGEAAVTAQRFMALQPDFRLQGYAARCPIRQPMLDQWIARLRSAGLPD